MLLQRIDNIQVKHPTVGLSRASTNGLNWVQIFTVPVEDYNIHYPVPVDDGRYIELLSLCLKGNKVMIHRERYEPKVDVLGFYSTFSTSD